MADCALVVTDLQGRNVGFPAQWQSVAITRRLNSYASAEIQLQKHEPYASQLLISERAMQIYIDGVLRMHGQLWEPLVKNSGGITVNVRDPFAGLAWRRNRQLKGYTNQDAQVIAVDRLNIQNAIRNTFLLAPAFDLEDPVVRDGNLTDGSAVVTGVVTDGLGVGHSVLGGGIPAGTKIASIDSPTQLTLSAVVDTSSQKSGSVVTGSPTISGISDTSDLSIGMSVRGQYGGLPEGATVIAIPSSTTVTMSHNSFFTGGVEAIFTLGNPVSLTFTPEPTVGRTVTYQPGKREDEIFTELSNMFDGFYFKVNPIAGETPPMSASLLDDFNRANEGPPMTGWSNWASGGIKVLANQCAPNATGFCSGYRTASMAGPDVEAYVTIASEPPNTGITYVCARIDPAGGGAFGDFYSFRTQNEAGTDFHLLERYDDGVATLLASGSQEIAAGDAIGIRCVGQTIEGWLRLSGVWTLVATATDATYSGLSPNNKVGIITNNPGSADARYDNFAAGVIESDAFKTPILDTFDRADEEPVTGWTDFPSGAGMKVATNKLAPAGTGQVGAYFNAPMSSKDVEAYITISTLPNDTGSTVLYARSDPAGGGVVGNNYAVRHTYSSGGTDLIIISRHDAGASVQLASYSKDLAAGDGLGIRCIGSTIEAWARLSGVWVLIGRVTDTTYDGSGTQNKLALTTFDSVTAPARWDDFGGGAVSSAKFGRLDLMWPDAGITRPQCRFEYGEGTLDNLESYEQTQSLPRNRHASSSSANDGSGRIVGVFQDIASQDRFGLFEDETTYSEIDEAPLLEAFAQADVRPSPPTTYAIQPGPEAPLLFSAFDVGDFVRLTIRDAGALEMSDWARVTEATLTVNPNGVARTSAITVETQTGGKPYDSPEKRWRETINELRWRQEMLERKVQNMDVPEAAPPNDPGGDPGSGDDGPGGAPPPEPDPPDPPAPPPAQPPDVTAVVGTGANVLGKPPYVDVAVTFDPKGLGAVVYLSLTPPTPARTLNFTSFGFSGSRTLTFRVENMPTGPGTVTVRVVTTAGEDTMVDDYVVPAIPSS